MSLNCRAPHHRIVFLFWIPPVMLVVILSWLAVTHFTLLLSVNFTYPQCSQSYHVYYFLPLSAILYQIVSSLPVYWLFWSQCEPPSFQRSYAHPALTGISTHLLESTPYLAKDRVIRDFPRTVSPSLDYPSENQFASSSDRAWIS